MKGLVAHSNGSGTLQLNWMFESNILQKVQKNGQFRVPPLARQVHQAQILLALQGL